MRDRDFIERLIDRAKAAKCSALVLTLDLQILGQRHKDLKNGLSVPPKPTLANLLNLMTKPRWCLGMLGTKRRTVRQHRRPRQGRERHGSLSPGRPSSSTRAELGRRRVGQEALGRQADPEGHPGRRGRALAVDSGADALIVSNHGGRQLDGAPSSIARAAGDRRCGGLEDRSLDGRRHPLGPGRAQGLGAGRASGTMIGRAFLYGLGAMGEAGVTKALEIIHKELDLTMAFCGY
jgi:L-lactate dehydrogenase (cytochrome)